MTRSDSFTSWSSAASRVTGVFLCAGTSYPRTRLSLCLVSIVIRDSWLSSEQRTRADVGEGRHWSLLTLASQRDRYRDSPRGTARDATRLLEGGRVRLDGSIEEAGSKTA